MSIPAPADSSLATSQMVANNQTHKDWPGLRHSLHELIDAQATRTPSAPALSFEGLTLTHGELRHLSDVLAGQLGQKGVGIGDKVALLMERGLELVVSLLGILKAGATYIPLDTGLPTARLKAMLDDAAPRLVLLSAGQSHPDPQAATWLVSLQALQGQGAPKALPSVKPDDLAYAIYTSGSTGLPKAAANAHLGIVNRLLWMQDEYPLSAHDVVLQKTPYSFDVSVWEFFWPLMVGARMVIARPGGHLDPDYLCELIVKEGVTVLHFVPTILRIFLDSTPNDWSGPLRLVFCSGEALPRDLMEKVLSRWPSTELHNLYGPTECAVDVTHWDCRAHADAPKVLIGHPVANTRIYILDEGFRPVPSGETGELFIAGIQVGAGYLNRPELTKERFLPDPFLALFPQALGHDMYRTGDLGRLTEGGGIEYLGRTDFQVKISGVRIELGDIESAILKTRLCSDALVVTQADAGGQLQLVAAVIPANPEAMGHDWHDQLVDELRRVLPRLMMPARIEALDAMPLTSSGKADRKQVQAMLKSGASTAPAEVPPATTADTNEVMWLTLAWEQALGQRPTSPDANYISHGGTSLSALRISAILRQLSGRKVSPSMLLQHASLAEQARALALCPAAQATRLEATPKTSMRGEGDLLQLTRQQDMLIVGGALDDTGAAMLVHVPLLIPATLSLASLRSAFASLWQRHAIFRVQARLEDEQVLTQVAPTLPDGWWTEHPARSDHPMDLDWPPDLLERINRPLPDSPPQAVRVDVWPLLDGRHFVVWTLHHFVIDEASTDHCLQELDTLLRGQTLPSLAEAGGLFRQLEAAWLDPEGIRLQALALVNSRKGSPPPFQRNLGASHEHPFELDASLNAEIETFSRTRGGTPFSLLLCAFGSAVQSTWGHGFRHVLTPFSRRQTDETMAPVGYFLDVRMIDAGSLPGELAQAQLDRVQQQVLQAMEPAFQPLHLIAEQVAALDGEVARGLGAFCMTWRQAPGRTLSLGHHTAELLRYPHTGSKFGVTLHLAAMAGRIRCSVEALDTVPNAQVQALIDSFSTHLQRLVQGQAFSSDQPTLRPIGTSETRLCAHAVPCAIEPHIAQAWRRWLNLPSTASVAAPDHFFQLGGTSLGALRLVAELRKQLDRPLSVSRFMTDPTLGQLQAMCAAGPEVGHALPAGIGLEGSPDADSLWILIPGYGGHAVGLLSLAQKLRRQAGPSVAVVTIELADLVESLPADDQIADRLIDLITRLIKELGPERVRAFAGFSLGGQLAVEVSKNLGLDQACPVFMMDTYTPRSWHGETVRRWGHPLIHLMYRWLGVPKAAQSREAMLVVGDEEGDVPMSPQARAHWKALERLLPHLGLASARQQVHLIQAGHSQWYTALVHRRSTNGFDPSKFASLDVYKLPVHHLELPKAANGLAASVMVQVMRDLALLKDS